MNNNLNINIGDLLMTSDDYNGTAAFILGMLVDKYIDLRGSVYVVEWYTNSWPFEDRIEHIQNEFFIKSYRNFYLTEVDKAYAK